VSRYPWLNHVCNVWWRSVKGFGRGYGSTFPFPHWQYSRTTMRVCDYKVQFRFLFNWAIFPQNTLWVRPDRPKQNLWALLEEFLQVDALPVSKPTASLHWTGTSITVWEKCIIIGEIKLTSHTHLYVLLQSACSNDSRIFLRVKPTSEEYVVTKCCMLHPCILPS